MRQITNRSWPLVAAMIAVGAALPVDATEIADVRNAADINGVADVRGGVYYDQDGKIVATKHVDPPDTETREPSSFLEQYDALGIELPQLRSTLSPRTPRAKPEFVAQHARQIRNQIMVKFVEGREFRLQEGALNENGARLASVESLLASYPQASLARAFSTDERILDENKIAAERMSGNEHADLNNYYLVTFPSASPDVISLANAFLALDEVELAYLPSEASIPGGECADLSPATPSYLDDQFYLDPAPDGIDAEFAWGYHPSANGVSSFWTVDIEWEWCLSHEDLDIEAGDVLGGSIGSTPLTLNHGTAVLGVYGGCDNGVGVRGISDGVTLKMSDIDSEPSLASNIATATSNLQVGEVMLLEVQINGPSTGGTCPCNCSQYEDLPVEWDSASYDAISTATAGGIVVIEAAGNGSVDLDHPVYGGWFNVSNDSGAIMVGAANPGAHNLSCFTNYGGTVDCHAYGAGVTTTGYGDLFNQSGCSQDYTDTFAGTSSASPIVMGAANVIQNIANQKYGIDLSPAFIRAALRTGGTPQGAPASRNIGPMPNLVNAINYFEPDLSPANPAGWDFSIVPSATADTEFGDVALDAPALPGGGTTYVSTVTQNGYHLTPVVAATELRLYVSDVFSIVAGVPPLSPFQYAWVGDFPLSIVGGRHTMRAVWDATDLEAEFNESNNSYSRPFIWSGLGLTEDAPLSRAWTPERAPVGVGAFPDAEGFSGASGSNYWYGFAVMPTQVGDDFDIKLHSETPMNVPQAGWGAAVANSATIGDGIDFVVVDRNHAGAGTYYASVTEWGAGADKRVEFEADEGGLDVGVNGPFTVGSNDLFELHELSLGAGVSVRVQIQWVSGSADFGVSAFDGTSTYHSKLSALATSSRNGAGEDEWVNIDASTADFFGIAVWKTRSSELSGSFTYNVIVDQNANLSSLHPSGWYGPIVPRTTDDATSAFAPLPAVLTGNAPSTRFNWAGINQGPVDVTTPFNNKLFVDDVFSWWQEGRTLTDDTPLYALNTGVGGPFSEVRGGRHHLRSFIDSEGSVSEFFEADNQYTDWFVWTPLDLDEDTPITRSAPPVRDPVGFGPFFSSDGFRAETTDSFWTAVAITPTLAADEYDIRLYEPLTGSRVGFGVSVAQHSSIGGGTTVGVVNYNRVSGSVTDFAAVNYTDGEDDFVIHRTNAGTTEDLAALPHIVGSNTIDGGSIVAAHEVHVDESLVGMSIPVTLTNLSGDANLAIAVFDNDETYAGVTSGMEFADAFGDGENESLTVTFDEASYYGIVVYKVGWSDLVKDAEYRIFLGDLTVGAEETVSVPDAFALGAARPNPFHTNSVVRFEVPAAGGDVRVSVFDTAGRLVKTLADGARSAGSYEAHWDGANADGRRVRPGVYFVEMRSREGRQSRKLVLMD